MVNNILITKYVKLYKFCQIEKHSLYSIVGVKNIAKDNLTEKEYKIFELKIKG